MDTRSILEGQILTSSDICGMCHGSKVQDLSGGFSLQARPVHIPCPYCRGTGFAAHLLAQLPVTPPKPLEVYGPPAPPWLIIDETVEPCSCTSCVKACRTRPGWFLPGEAEKAAELLGMTMPDFFDKHLVVDYWLDLHGDDDGYVLAPAILGDEGGMASYDNRGTCSLLKDGLCSIHDAKPFECRAYTHNDRKATSEERRHAIAWAWFKPQHQEQLKQLNDYLYTPDSPSGFGLWSSLW